MKTLSKILATTLSASMLFSAVACTPTGTTQDEKKESTYSYLAIDINPSVELVIDGETVVSVKACNEDAAVLLSGENFEGLPVEEVSESIVELAEELGYLNTDNYDVKITVTADSEDIYEKIKEFARKGAEKGSELAKINYNPRSADESKVKELLAENAEAFAQLTPAKLRLIEAIMEYDDTMTYEDGAAMKVSELTAALDKYAKDYKDIVGGKLEELFENTFNSIKDLAKGKIAEVYGEEYNAAWTKFVELQKVVKEIAEKAKNVQISEEDKQAILDLLEQKPQGDKPADAPAKPEENDEKWKVEDYHKYFDKHFHHKFEEDKFDEVQDAIEEILDKYEGDKYVLTEEDLAALAQAWGEAIQAETFEELEAFLKAEMEKLEELRKTMEESLRLDQKIQIEIMEEAPEKIMEKARELIKGEIESAKQEWKALKEQKRNNK